MHSLPYGPYLVLIIINPCTWVQRWQVVEMPGTGSSHEINSEQLCTTLLGAAGSRTRLVALLHCTYLHQQSNCLSQFLPQVAAPGTHSFG
jgi:hypothetical protein